MNILDIHKAACLYADSVEADYTKDGQNYFRGYANEMKDLVRQSFFTGARWYEYDFINLLWHDAKEEPRKYALCLVYAKFTCEGHVPFEEYVTSVYTPLGWTEDYFPQDYDYTIIRWCYLSDLLPHGGGEK